VAQLKEAAVQERIRLASSLFQVGLFTVAITAILSTAGVLDGTGLAVGFMLAGGLAALAGRLWISRLERSASDGRRQDAWAAPRS
jgi:hypothetical protein